MSMNLIHTNRNETETLAARNWAAITAIAPEHGMVFIDEDVVNAIARLVEDQALTNGEVVCSYPTDEGCEWAMPSYVPAFGPSLLPVIVQDQIRDRLAGSVNGKQAVRLFNEVLRLKLQISLSGKEFCGAHIKAVNWNADEVEINRTSGNMFGMLRELGLSVDAGEDPVNEYEFDVFAKAVEANAHYTDCAARLLAFVECARRNQATHVYAA